MGFVWFSMKSDLLSPMYIPLMTLQVIASLIRTHTVVNLTFWGFVNHEYQGGAVQRCSWRGSSDTGHFLKYRHRRRTRRELLDFAGHLNPHIKVWKCVSMCSLKLYHRPRASTAKGGNDILRQTARWSMTTHCGGVFTWGKKNDKTCK